MWRLPLVAEPIPVVGFDANLFWKTAMDVIGGMGRFYRGMLIGWYCYGE